MSKLKRKEYEADLEKLQCELVQLQQAAEAAMKDGEGKDTWPLTVADVTTGIGAGTVNAALVAVPPPA